MDVVVDEARPVVEVAFPVVEVEVAFPVVEDELLDEDEVEELDELDEADENPAAGPDCS